ncbi:EAL domain-containing protein [Erythrobacter sp.]|uniref:putative bifunctional diguanylate cyclase/phosphodiesterase n=1 Tax=Erythrobacter sp. TaxID=1042 RepID=UPI001425BC0D|nr:EAL domain-containing protein [Erythrobacter sp.]QIQ87809.1 MAG: EAL domain-containing protein [Erythrobacter sp.]
MAEMAVSDTLIRLPNRPGFDERLPHLIDAQTGADRCAAVMMLDLDRFKNVNDKYGHPAGDRVLVEVGKRVAALLRECETVARLGGDEFAVILRKLDCPGQASATAERIIDAVCRPIMLREGEVSVGTSIGITIFPDNEGSSDELMKCADLALGEAKRAGKGCYRFYDPAMQEEVSRKHAMAEELERAFDEDQIKVYLQPILLLETGAVTFAESLVRWDDGTPGPLAAGEFIDVIDEFQLAPRLEHAVFSQVFGMVKQWHHDGIDYPVVTLNLSAADLRSSKFCERIIAAVEKHELRADMFALEILETALFERGAETVENNIRRLSDLGFRIMLDNFGVGHASLTHLTCLPADYVKVDKSLIACIQPKDAGETIPGAVLKLAKGLGINTIAEGVENERHLSWLMSMNCDYAQGYFFHAPIPLKTFDLYLRGGVFASSEREGLAQYRLTNS